MSATNELLKMKSLIIVLFAMFLLAGMADAVFAEDNGGDNRTADVVAQGNISSYDAVSSVQWTLYNDGLLQVTGQGEMYAGYTYDYPDTSPFKGYTDQIIRIEIGEGITNAAGFFSCPNLETVVLPDSVKTIYPGAFYKCEKLNSINLPDGIKEIGGYAFSGCDKLDINGWPANLERIDNYAFFYCKSLSNVKIPASITYIGNQAFEYCPALRSLIMTKTPETFGEAVFSATGLTSVQLPDDLETIPCQCFSGCDSLKTITIPESVKNIEADTFNGCEALENITIPGSVRTIGDGAFGGCKALKSITIPDSVINFGTGVFAGCESLMEVSLPNTMARIPDETFWGCSSLTNLELIDGIREIGDEAFSHCTGLQHIGLTGNVRKIGKGAFAYSGLIEVTLPEGVEIIGEDAFSYCGQLTSVSLPKTITSMGKKTFVSCEALSNVSFAPGFTCISNGAFSGCKSLTAVSIPSSVAYIGDSAFSSCTSLEKVRIPDNVRTINTGAFNQCHSLKRVIFSDVTTIEESAFSGSGLEYVYHIGTEEEWESINIGDDNSELRSAYLEHSSRKCGDDLTWSVEDDTLLITGTGKMYDFYGSSYVPWYIFNEDIRTIIVDSGVEGITSHAFGGLPHLKEMHLPTSLTSISSTCIDMDVANGLDCYYEGDETAWKMLTSFGPDSPADPLYKVNMHYAITYTYDPWVTYHYGNHTEQKLKTFPFIGGITKKADMRTEVSCKWGFDLFKQHSFTPNKDLAVASLLLSANIYDWGTLSSTLSSMGFKSIVFMNDKGDGTFNHYDNINRVGYAMAMTVQKINGKKTNVIAVVCRGSTGTFGISADWQSNILQQAKGFKEAADNIHDEGLKAYMRRVDTSLPTKFLITGHSRGGAVANLLGDMVYDLADNVDQYVYTFACPNTSTALDRGSKDFYNIEVAGDPVPVLPIMIGGHNKFGKIIVLKPRVNEQDFIQVFHEITGDVSTTVLDNTDDCESSYPRIIRHHAPAVYMACLLQPGNSASGDDELVEALNHPTRYKVRCFSVHCPVDVYVYDQYNNLLGTIIGNVPSDDLIENGIYAEINGDQKDLYTGLAIDLKLKLVGTGSGTMNYSQKDYDQASGEIISQAEFRNVPITDGKTMSTEAGCETDAEDNKLFVVDEQGNQIEEIEKSKVSPTPSQDPKPVAAAIKAGATFKVNGLTVKVISPKAKTVALTKGKNAKSSIVPDTVKLKGKSFKVTRIDAKAFAGKKIRTVTVGRNVQTIKKNAFKGSKATKVIVKTRKLTKKTVKGCFSGSKVKKVQVKIGGKAVNKKFVKKYKKIFTKKNTGRKVTVK